MHLNFLEGKMKRQTLVTRVKHVGISTNVQKSWARTRAGSRLITTFTVTVMNFEQPTTLVIGQTTTTTTIYRY